MTIQFVISGLDCSAFTIKREWIRGPHGTYCVQHAASVTAFRAEDRNKGADNVIQRHWCFSAK